MSGDAALAVCRAILGGGAIELAPGQGPPFPWPEETSDELDAALVEIDGAARGDAPGSAPAFDLRAARWGLIQLTWLARCLVDRRADVDDIVRRTEDLHAADHPKTTDPAHVWSVDLTLRYLKDLRPQVRSFVEADPARQHYERLVRDWPLSCPVKDASASHHWTHPTLRRLALDRIEAK